MSETIKDAQQGSADSIEAVLTAQVLALGAIFANIAHGPQQVNNAPSEERKEEKDSSRKKSEIEQNKLLEADEKGNRLDFGTAGNTVFPYLLFLAETDS